MVLSRALRLSVFSLGLGAIHAVAVLAALNLSGCDPEGPPRRADALASRIELAAGNVSVKQPGGEWERAIAGLLLRHGAQVKVGAGDRALIRLDDGSAVFMRHGTEVRWSARGCSWPAGEVWIDAPPADKRAGALPGRARSRWPPPGAGLDIRKARGRGAGLRGPGPGRGLGARAAAPSCRRGSGPTVRGKAAPKVCAAWPFGRTGPAAWPTGTLRRRAAAARAAGRSTPSTGSRAGAPPQELEIRAQHVQVVIRDGVARTTWTSASSTPTSTPVEGYYWFTVPEGAAVDRFALEVAGTLMDGEVIERKQAAAAYEAVDPPGRRPGAAGVGRRPDLPRADLPHPGGGRAPGGAVLPGAAAHGGRQDALRLPAWAAPWTARGCRSSRLEVGPGRGGQADEAGHHRRRADRGGGQRVSMRRSGFKPQGDFLLEMSGKRPSRCARSGWRAAATRRPT